MVPRSGGMGYTKDARGAGICLSFGWGLIPATPQEISPWPPGHSYMLVLLVEDAEHHFGFAHDFPVYEAAAAGFGEVAFFRRELHFDEEGVAGHDGFAELDGVGAHEVADFAGVSRLAQQ